MFLSHFSVLSSLVFPFLVREKAIETNNPRNNERASRVERERERERDLLNEEEKRSAIQQYSLVEKKKSDASSRFHLFFLNVFVVIPVREACRFGKQKSIDPIVSLLREEEEEEEKERGKKNLRKNERETDKDPPHHVDACVCVLFLLLCPRLNVRLQMCVDEMCC